MSLKCANNGCGQNFNAESNSETACIYHTGAAIFHEGLKGWGCCKKRVIDFDEMLQIPGCANGPHVPEPRRPSEPKKIVQTQTHIADDTPVSAPASTPKPTPAPPVSKPAPPQYKEERDPPNAVIKPGTTCKRLACKAIYHDEKSRTETCTYHPGEPVFHEGSKGYSCCKMVGDFDEFLKMPGCRKGVHKFVETKKDGGNKVECRHDWYQMGPNVVVCIFAKGINKEQSKIEFTEQTVAVELVLPEDKVYSRTFKLSMPIDPSKCKFEILSTKVEIKLYKIEGVTWATLEPTP